MRRISPTSGNGHSARTWNRDAGLLAWPHGWQRPGRTEEWAYEQYASSLERPRFAQLVCYPWATLIDLLDRGQIALAQSYLDALAQTPPPTTLIRATVCQHIHAERILPWLKALGITDLFWTHSRVDAPAIDGIRVHPFPLYPVRCHDRSEPLGAPEFAAINSDAPSLRKYLYSFVGAYCPDGYLTQVRQWIFDLPSRPDALVLRRSEWHYESVVYEQQIRGRQLDPADCARREQMAEDFDAAMRDSIFALCPSGSGPNSIRLWESLGFGSIPVLLADTLRLPGSRQEWDEAIVRVPETREAVSALPDRLAELARDRVRLEGMQQAGRHLWKRYGELGPLTVLSVLANNDWVRGHVIRRQ